MKLTQQARLTDDLNQSVLMKYTKDVKFQYSSEGKLYPHIEYDSVTNQIEKQSKKFLPKLETSQLQIIEKNNQLSQQDIIELHDLLDTKNDALKQEYIQMVTDGGEQNHLQYLMSESALNSKERFEKFKFEMVKAKSIKQLQQNQQSNLQQLNEQIKDLDFKGIDGMKSKIKKIMMHVERLIKMQVMPIPASPVRRRKLPNKEEKYAKIILRGQNKSLMIEKVLERKNTLLRNKIEKIEKQRTEHVEKSMEHMNNQELVRRRSKQF